MNTPKKERHTLLAKRIGMWVREKRLERNLKCGELADEVDISATQLREYERGVHIMKMTALFNILYALDCAPSEITELFEIDAELRMGGVS